MPGRRRFDGLMSPVDGASKSHGSESGDSLQHTRLRVVLVLSQRQPESESLYQISKSQEKLEASRSAAHEVPAQRLTVKALLGGGTPMERRVLAPPRGRLFPAT